MYRRNESVECMTVKIVVDGYFTVGKEVGIDHDGEYYRWEIFHRKKGKVTKNITVKIVIDRNFTVRKEVDMSVTVNIVVERNFPVKKEVDKECDGVNCRWEKFNRKADAYSLRNETQYLRNWPN